MEIWFGSKSRGLNFVGKIFIGAKNVVRLENCEWFGEYLSENRICI